MLSKWRRVERFYEGLQYEIHVALIDKAFVTFGDVVRATSETKRVFATRPRQNNDKRQQHLNHISQIRQHNRESRKMLQLQWVMDGLV